eukprot:31292-Pelagococcus_subviridis.AAC.12
MRPLLLLTLRRRRRRRGHEQRARLALGRLPRRLDLAPEVAPALLHLRDDHLAHALGVSRQLASLLARGRRAVAIIIITRAIITRDASSARASLAAVERRARRRRRRGGRRRAPLVRRRVVARRRRRRRARGGPAAVRRPPTHRGGRGCECVERRAFAFFWDLRRMSDADTRSVLRTMRSRMESQSGRIPPPISARGDFPTLRFQ